MAAGTLTKSAYARHRNVSPSMVTRWTQAGEIKITPDGKVDVAASDRMLAESQAPDRGGRGGRPSSRVVAAPEPDRGGRPVGPDGGADITYNRARTAREAINARSAELDYRQRIGELVERKQYDRALVDGLTPALSRLESLSARIGARVAAEADVRKCQAIVDDEVESIRHEIADTLRAMISAGGQTRQ